MPRYSKSSHLLISSSILFTLSGLLIANTLAYSNEAIIQPAEPRTSNEASIENHLSAAENIEQLKSNLTNSAEQSRKRRGRGYSSQLGYSNQPQSTLDSYAAAYAAANAPSSGEHPQDLVQSTVQASDPSSYASFGESSPNGIGSSSVASASRQIQASEYAPHSSYYSNYMSPSSSASSYSGQSGNYHYPQYRKSQSGYPSMSYDHHSTPSYYDSSYISGSSVPLWASGSPHSSGLMSSASSALSSWTGGFGIAEIICTLVAISIGAIILGAPFFLIYLALMGNFSGSGTLSLTNPTGGATPAGGATATVSGRRKRLAIFEQLANSSGMQRDFSNLGTIADTMMNKLSPFVDIQQVSSSFKRLVDSIDKYSTMKPEETKKKRS